jgi:hypothetical protein
MPNRPLSKREERTLRAAAECILPQGGPFPLGYTDVDYQAFVDEFLHVAPAQVRLLVHAILFTLEYGGWVYGARPGRFSNASLARRNAILDKARGSRIFAVRGFFILLSTILLMPFYNDPRVMDAVGYAGYRPNVNKAQGEGAA